MLEREGEPTALIDAWEGADALWLVDAVSSGAEPGTVHRLDASERALPPDLFRASTHHVGLAEAVELARALGRLPARTVVFGIEGGSFAVGEPLSPRSPRPPRRSRRRSAEEVAAARAAFAAPRPPALISYLRATSHPLIRALRGREGALE